jgi:hypothetical protein
MRPNARLRPLDGRRAEEGDRRAGRSQGSGPVEESSPLPCPCKLRPNSHLSPSTRATTRRRSRGPRPTTAGSTITTFGRRTLASCGRRPGRLPISPRRLSHGRLSFRMRRSHKLRHRSHWKSHLPSSRLNLLPSGSISQPCHSGSQSASATRSISSSSRGSPASSVAGSPPMRITSALRSHAPSA